MLPAFPGKAFLGSLDAFLCLSDPLHHMHTHAHTHAHAGTLLAAEAGWYLQPHPSKHLVPPGAHVLEGSATQDLPEAALGMMCQLKLPGPTCVSVREDRCTSD